MSGRSPVQEKEGMAFQSILFNTLRDVKGVDRQAPCFTDLNLDQVIEAITTPYRDDVLTSYFYIPLRDLETLHYRQEVMRDLENDSLMKAIKGFADGMERVRRYLAMAEKLEYDAHKKGWFLEAALLYCETLSSQARLFSTLNLTSRGLSSFRDYVTEYVRSEDFLRLLEDAKETKKGLSELTYCVIVQSGKFKVKRYEGESDYSIEVEKTFEKFKQGTGKDYTVKLPERMGLNHIEAKILEFVTKLFPEPFVALDRFYEIHRHFPDSVIQTFGREIRFYIAYLDFIADFKRQGLPFCLPKVTLTSKEDFARDSFDLALAHALRHTDATIVTNDFSLKDPERIIVVTGPNQGGKTTFARMFGQLHYLASLGCPVPGRQARLFLPDQILTHFEREEDIRNLRGKFEDDLFRMYDILQVATPDSLVVVNEIFASTALKDALYLSRKILEHLMALDVLCAWVTFIDELSSLSEKTVSMVATVVPEDPTRRTFKVVRKRADGLAYALSLAKKHSLTYQDIKERVS